MREIRLSGLEGGVALTRHPYPYMLDPLRVLRPPPLAPPPSVSVISCKIFSSRRYG